MKYIILTLQIGLLAGAFLSLAQILIGSPTVNHDILMFGLFMTFMILFLVITITRNQGQHAN